VVNIPMPAPAAAAAGAAARQGMVNAFMN
jgi:hypothetical protein